MQDMIRKILKLRIGMQTGVGWRMLATWSGSCMDQTSSVYRRALKATCILVPLFGLQFFLYVYRPFQEGQAYFLFEIFAKIINNTQVHSQLRSHLLRSRSRSWHHEARSFTFSTDGRRVSAKGSNIRLECIPLTSTSCAPSPNRDATSASSAHVKKWRVNLKKQNGASEGAMV
ncbi:calcitonin gene-related peptide type 1 receptor-like [Elysia marginata]|uniref:Calcitonin gene-related peptide type 1 receptor-like n=1 Tax=Elysia marginata TaxID=1093978 RepID=A0AAV4ER05_9GAST|nr:calcitonin gene-related peptide type 1 receptor-like [Elysia marginata]